MTILNATLAPTFAVVAQDTGVFSPDGGLIGHIEKLTILTEKRIVVGGRGTLAFAAAWAAAVKELPGLALEDADATAAALRRLRERVECHPEQTVLHVGWDRDANAPTGFLFTAANNFEPQRLIPGGG